ncbi:phospholipase D-like domain-containing protein [Sphingomonas sp. Ant20]|uniref:phospholipase D-like domain-containing protein n=1 Tax=Sphingomonas sp. Ant20 TaxID=104605 RepID=UPI0018E2D3D2|nr:phospholipase D-like domain-containing protein [Sphingomonas sp. Ant20]
MALLAMDWRRGRPPQDFVGFAIEYAEPGSDRFYPLKNRLTFGGDAGTVPSAERPETFSTLVAPIQKFRWIHFPRNAELQGDFSYRVTPMHMDADGTLEAGVAQTASLALARDTVPGLLNVAFTRGFVSSQAFVDRFARRGGIDSLVPGDADDGLTFVPTHHDAAAAYAWMGFEARQAIFDLLDAALDDPTAQVGVIAFDLNLPEIVERLTRLGSRARVIIDDSEAHVGGSEDEAERVLAEAGVTVRRQSMGRLQHNKTVYVDGDAVKQVLCGSTNMSWRGLYVQSNNALVLTGERLCCTKGVGIPCEGQEA